MYEFEHEKVPETLAWEKPASPGTPCTNISEELTAMLRARPECTAGYCRPVPSDRRNDAGTGLRVRMAHPQVPQFPIAT